LPARHREESFTLSLPGYSPGLGESSPAHVQPGRTAPFPRNPAQRSRRRPGRARRPASAPQRVFPIFGDYQWPGPSPFSGKWIYWTFPGRALVPQIRGIKTQRHRSPNSGSKHSAIMGERKIAASPGNGRHQIVPSSCWATNAELRTSRPMPAGSIFSPSNSEISKRTILAHRSRVFKTHLGPAKGRIMPASPQPHSLARIDASPGHGTLPMPTD